MYQRKKKPRKWKVEEEVNLYRVTNDKQKIKKKITTTNDDKVYFFVFHSIYFHAIYFLIIIIESIYSFKNSYKQRQTKSDGEFYYYVQKQYIINWI